jgi:N-acetylglucosaminyl-diphospho-decaprenol L-rhamnosyltransferase
VLAWAILPSPVPTVHAIVVHRRGEALLSRCLESLLASRGVDLRVAVVANACEEPLPPAAERDRRVYALRSAAPLGFAAASNRGAAFLRERAGLPDHLYFVNDDTASDPDALSRLAGHLVRDPRCAIAGPRLRIDGTSRLNSLGLSVTRDGEAWDEGIGRPLDEASEPGGPRPVLAVTGSALLVRREAFAALGGWEEIYGWYYEDVDLCLRARAAGWDVALVPAATVSHAVSATARETAFKLEHMLRNRLVLLAVHWPPALLLASVPRLLAAECWRLAVRISRGDRLEARAQVRAWGGFLRLLPATLARRRRRGPRRDWVALLRPAGSVPPIRLAPS